jgi:hypothetical protein
VRAKNLNVLKRTQENDLHKKYKCEETRIMRESGVLIPIGTTITMYIMIPLHYIVFVLQKKTITL